MEQQYNQRYRNLLGIGAVLICFLLLLPALRFMPADAQSQSTSADISRDIELDDRVRAFFDSLQRENLSAAFEGLLVQSPLSSPAAMQQHTDLRNKVAEARNQFGEILNWEKYDTKPIGTDVVIVRYVLKYDQYPVIWTFMFYRKPSSSPGIPNPNRWVVVGLQFDPNLL